MKMKVKAMRIVRSIQLLLIGIEIEVNRKLLGFAIMIKKSLTSDLVIRISNGLSRLGIKWMHLCAEVRWSPPLREWQVNNI